MAEENPGTLDAAPPLAPRLIEVDLIVAQQVMGTSTNAGRKKEIRNDVVGWLIQAADERCGLCLETLNATDRETSVFVTGRRRSSAGSARSSRRSRPNRDAYSPRGAFAEITDALQRPSVTARTPLDIIRAQTREAAALRFQRECVAAPQADPAGARCKAPKEEANAMGGG